MENKGFKAPYDSTLYLSHKSNDSNFKFDFFNKWGARVIQHKVVLSNLAATVCTNCKWAAAVSICYMLLHFNFSYRPLIKSKLH